VRVCARIDCVIKCTYIVCVCVCVCVAYIVILVTILTCRLIKLNKQEISPLLLIFN